MSSASNCRTRSGSKVIANRAGPSRRSRTGSGTWTHRRESDSEKLAPASRRASTTKDLQEGEPCHVDLAVEEFHQIALHGLPRPQVHDVDLALLAEAVHPPDPLFDAQGIPREIVVHDRPRELQVPALAAGLRAQEHLSVPLERPHRAIFRRRREAAVVERDAM